MKKSTGLFLLSFVLLVSCKTDTPPMVGGSPRSEEDILISAGFVDDNTYRIVCRGYPMPEYTGVQAENTAMEAARLNAIYFVKRDFDSSVDPGIYGSVERYERMNEHVVVYYIVRKKDLKRFYDPGHGDN